MSVLRVPRIGAAIIAALFSAFVLLASGCSALRIGYSSAPDLIYWWLDGYADFDAEQTPRVREAIAQWFAWHRRSQLPDYAALLAQAKVEVLADTTPVRGCEWERLAVDRARLAFEQIVPAAAALALTVTPQQVRHVERRYAKFNDEFRRDFLNPDPAKRNAAALKRVVERAEMLYGSLDDAQIELIAKELARSPFDAEVWFAERRARQLQALELLRHGGGSDGADLEQMRAALRAYAAQVERSPREAYRRYAQRLREFNCAFAANLHNATSRAQRGVAAGRLAGWESDLRAIAAAAR